MTEKNNDPKTLLQHFLDPHPYSWNCIDTQQTLADLRLHSCWWQCSSQANILRHRGLRHEAEADDATKLLIEDLQQIHVRFPTISMFQSPGFKSIQRRKLQSFQFIPLFPLVFPEPKLVKLRYVKLPQLPPPRVVSMGCSSVEPDTISTAQHSHRGIFHSTAQIFTSGHRRKVLSLADHE